VSTRTTICIVHHNTPDWLEASLRRIGRHTDSGTAVLVVENGSNAEIRDTAKSVCKSHGAEVLVLPEAVSHGAALDAAVARVSTPWMLVIDSDAFPVRDGWLRDIHAAADKMVLVGAPAATSHNENPFGNYAHPSLCLVDMSFLRRSETRFRDAWPRWDTGEQLTIEAMRLGLGVRYLTTVSFNTYGSGVLIGDSVFHAYYGTRLKVLSAQELLDADGVDAKRLGDDHARLLESEKKFADDRGPDPFAALASRESPRPDMSVIVPFRRRDDMSSRSLEAVLRSLDMQTMEREKYEIIVVETAPIATVSEDTGYRTILAHCPGPHFRKSWAMNVGFRHATGGYTRVPRRGHTCPGDNARVDSQPHRQIRPRCETIIHGSGHEQGVHRRPAQGQRLQGGDRSAEFARCPGRLHSRDERCIPEDSWVQRGLCRMGRRG